MDLVLHIVHKAALWRWWLMPILIVGSVVATVTANARARARGEDRPRMIWLPPLCIGLGVLNFLGGTGLSARLIHSYGHAGQAVITGTYATGVVYNDHDVLGYNVLMKTADGRTVETRFQEDDFNLYPPRNSVTYPEVGDHFNVRYLPGFPRDFVILADDDSPWARGLKCDALKTRLAEATQKYQFSTSSPAYRKAYADAIQAITDNDPCSLDEVSRGELRQDLAGLLAGR